ncbi:PREDICTED: protein lin-9 homolog [Priapulus caudatus]|uniref:Protein lin-9 homolog n=1 Tax=Priapulus caudatus TaxID=37621 RepID=A0ABM1EIZ5_PRICU|nr:PREDICTED: protein lin-9 homolog [Priapulus caudatus]
MHRPKYKEGSLVHVADAVYDMFLQVELMFRNSQDTLMEGDNVKQRLVDKAIEITDEVELPACHKVKQKQLFALGDTVEALVALKTRSRLRSQNNTPVKSVTAKSPVKSPSKQTCRRVIGRQAPAPKALVHSPRYARKRKKTKLFDSDDTGADTEDEKPAIVDVALSSGAQNSLGVLEKRVAERLGARLRNILKLPKAHRWVCHEWFYASIDNVLLASENEFQQCLKDMLPHLKTCQLTRVEWCKIRRYLGKPRRCSQAFFREEVQSLHERRDRVRLLQQNKALDAKMFKDMPSEIPLPLHIGTLVTARLRKPQDGLFTGVIDAVDTQNATYRITFDRPGLGIRYVPDFEVLSNEAHDTVPLASYVDRHPPARLIFSSPPPPLPTDLPILTRLMKILRVKKEHIERLKELNCEAEKMKSLHDALTEDFKKKYAQVVLDLEQLNLDLNEHMLGIQQYCREIAPEHGIVEPLAGPLASRRRCVGDAEEMVRRCSGEYAVTADATTRLVMRLTALMMQIQSLSQHELSSFDFNSMSNSLTEIKETLEPANHRVFQDHVEIHINHIQSGLSQMGNLHAFSIS